MARISITDLTFSHGGGRPLFQGLSLALDTRWRLGLVGRNGRGKTTLLKLLAGELDHDGSIRTPPGVAYFPYPVADPGQAGRVAVRATHPGLEDWRLEREASLLGLEPEALDLPFRTLSGGEAAKLLLASLFAGEECYPLIDEPTNHLDLEARRVVAQYLRSKDGFILVSHDRSLLDGCVDHILALTRTGAELLRGDFTAWCVEKDQRDQREMAENRRLKREVDRLRASASRSAEWSRRAEAGKFGNGPVDRGFIGHKAARMMQRSKAVEARRERAVEEKSRLLRDLEENVAPTMRPLVFHSRRLAEASGLWAGYGRDGGEAHDVLRGLSLNMESGQRLALLGRNGCGKSTLLRLLAGEGIPHRGTLRLAPGLVVSHVPQDTSHLRGGLNEFAQGRGVDQHLLRAALHRLGFERGQFDGDLADYSAGQRKKVLLAASLCQEAHLYLWDEPLNHIDVLSRMQIEALILEYRPTMVFVEHDRAFLERVATDVLDLGGMEP